MTTYFIDLEDFVGLRNHRLSLERLPQQIESFKIIFDLVPPRDRGKYIEPALEHVTRRASTALNFWPDNVQDFRALHEELEAFITQVKLFANQLATYQGQQARNARKLPLSDLPIHKPPFALQGKLGVAPGSTAIQLLDHINESQTHFGAHFLAMAMRVGRMRTNAYGIIPRFIDFMDAKIAEHARKGQAGSVRLEKQLATAHARVMSTHMEYRDALQSSSNMSAYNIRMATLLFYANRELQGIDPQTPTDRLMFRIGLISARLDELNKLSSRVRSLLQYSL